MIGLLKAETRSPTQVVQKERSCEQLDRHNPARLPTTAIGIVITGISRPNPPGLALFFRRKFKGPLRDARSTGYRPVRDLRLQGPLRTLVCDVSDTSLCDVRLIL